ncbi:hypothetical protein PIB30_088252, partial [Stylosanthes scabra]|nr:hypothetical protein [Stylosanthes scabra]
RRRMATEETVDGRIRDNGRSEDDAKEIGDGRSKDDDGRSGRGDDGRRRKEPGMR